MKSWHCSFNIFFALGCLAVAGGCAAIRAVDNAADPKKEQSTIRLYIEGQKADRATSGTVLVTRARIPFTIQREPFLDEADLAKASIVEDQGGDGGYSIQLTFNDHGTLLLDMNTSDNMGRHIIVFSQFPTPGKKAHKAEKKDGSDDADLVEPGMAQPPAGTNTTRESGWLAAVLIRQRISSGVFRFTPDASRAEGNRIVRGLRNVIGKENKKD